jgi:hypothetical protein
MYMILISLVLLVLGCAGPEGEQGRAGKPGPVGPAGVEGKVGPVGPKGNTGDPGEQGPVGPKGGQGDPGPRGIAGEPAFVIEVIDPCGDNPDDHDEVLLRINPTCLVAYMQINPTEYLTCVPAGIYQTTDTQRCRFEIDSIGAVSWD